MIRSSPKFKDMVSKWESQPELITIGNTVLMALKFMLTSDVNDFLKMVESAIKSSSTPDVPVSVQLEVQRSIDHIFIQHKSLHIINQFDTTWICRQAVASWRKPWRSKLDLNSYPKAVSSSIKLLAISELPYRKWIRNPGLTNTRVPILTNKYKN